MAFEPKGILEIKGTFMVPDYQRGYRWGKSEVELLLNDIHENEKQNGKNYYLQPIVVKKIGTVCYELIDGQQRLTTLYLILQYMRKYLPSAQLPYEIIYKTRKATHDYLLNIELSRKEENIDFFFIANAFEAIEQWFNRAQDCGKDLLGLCINFYQQLNNNVKIIWYEPEDNISGVELFTRLNIGRIPLTNSELVRALFLSKNTGSTSLTDAKQLEIATEWDTLEKELHEPLFWAFLTNYTSTEYPNRIELLFDMMAGGRNIKDRYATFFFFSNQIIKQQKKKETVWDAIMAYYARLKEWYENRELFHKAGYLIASNHEKLRCLLDETNRMKKSELIQHIDKKIRDSLKSITALENLNYPDDRIHTVLLLFNILSIMKNNDVSLRFPFDKYKENRSWSLEHIHAQNAEALDTNEKRREWLTLHKDALENRIEQLTLHNKTPEEKQNEEDIESLINDINEVLRFGNISGARFIFLQERVFKIFSTGEDDNYINRLSNMALLNGANNTALSNSVFEVKRQKIIQMDKEGCFIPYCTRMVFFKYYNTENTIQLHSWDDHDRDNYFTAIKNLLSQYLPEGRQQ